MIPEEVPFQQGVLDLQDWRADDRNTVALNGSGPFIRINGWAGMMVSRGAEACRRSALDKGSRPWEGVNEYGSQMGFGTYRLKLLVPERNVTYGLWITDIRTAYRLYVNGELLYESDIPPIRQRPMWQESFPYRTHPRLTETSWILS